MVSHLNYASNPRLSPKSWVEGGLGRQKGPGNNSCNPGADPEKNGVRHQHVSASWPPSALASPVGGACAALPTSSPVQPCVPVQPCGPVQPSVPVQPCGPIQPCAPSVPCCSGPVVARRVQGGRCLLRALVNHCDRLFSYLTSFPSQTLFPLFTLVADLLDTQLSAHLALQTVITPAL